MPRLRLAFATFAFVACTLVSASAFAADAPVEGAAVTPTPVPLVRVEDDDLRMRFSGAWTGEWHETMSGQTFHMSGKAGSSAWVSFEGTGAAFVSRFGPKRGRAAIYLDGALVETIDFYAPANSASRSVWSTDTLAPGPHTIKVIALGKKSSASAGTGVVVDAFEVPKVTSSGSAPGTGVSSASGRLARTGSWYTSKRTGAIGGSALRTRKKGATLTIRFNGSGVMWIGRKDPNMGKAEVLLDGKRVAIVSQYRPSAAERRVAYSVTGLPYGVHTLTIRCLDEKSASAGGDLVEVDSFSIHGTLLQAYRPTPFKYPWRTYIVVDKSSFRLYWVKNGLLIKTYPIAHGRVGASTPNRVWRIDAKYQVDPKSVYGPRKMRLFKQVKTSKGYRYEYTRYLIHGTNQEWTIGTRASAGCIRMYNKDVLELWPQVPLGTMVITRD